MLIKLTAGNQITLPDAILTSVDAAEYFAVTVEDGRIILTPVSIQKSSVIRQKLEHLGITEQDVEDAVDWVRR